MTYILILSILGFVIWAARLSSEATKNRILHQIDELEASKAEELYNSDMELDRETQEFLDRNSQDVPSDTDVWDAVDRLYARAGRSTQISETDAANDKE